MHTVQDAIDLQIRRERHIIYLLGKGYGQWIHDCPIEEIRQYVRLELFKALQTGTSEDHTQ